MSDLVRLTVQNPAKALGFEAGVIEVGKRVDLILLNPNISSLIKNEQSLYNNQVLSGEVKNF